MPQARDDAVTHHGQVVRVHRYVLVVRSIGGKPPRFFQLPGRPTSSTIDDQPTPVTRSKATETYESVIPDQERLGRCVSRPKIAGPHKAAANHESWYIKQAARRSSGGFCGNLHLVASGGLSTAGRKGWSGEGWRVPHTSSDSCWRADTFSDSLR